MTKLKWDTHFIIWKFVFTWKINAFSFERFYKVHATIHVHGSNVQRKLESHFYKSFWIINVTYLWHFDYYRLTQKNNKIITCYFPYTLSIEYIFAIFIFYSWLQSYDSFYFPTFSYRYNLIFTEFIPKNFGIWYTILSCLCNIKPQKVMFILDKKHFFLNLSVFA